MANATGFIFLLLDVASALLVSFGISLLACIIEFLSSHLILLICGIMSVISHCSGTYTIRLFADLKRLKEVVNLS